jgi:hypothetical protein
VSGDPLREEAFESRWEAAPAVAAIIALQALLAFVSEARGWILWQFDWWVWLVPAGPEALLLGALGFDRPRHRLEQLGKRRETALILLGIVSLANALLLVAVLASLLNGQEHSGGQLLLKAGTLWGTNTITYGLWFWAVDQGGPVRRCEPDPPPPDFQFPQLENPELAAPDWYPQLLDYLYVSLTNSIAFSPTDAMPLSRRAKLLMASESVVSALTTLLVAARAVNIFKG